MERSTAFRVRELRARGLSTEGYLRELAKLADIERDAQVAVELNEVADNGMSLSVAERLMALRGQIRALEQRVRELEARK